MKIKDIKNKELRELAESYIDESYIDYQNFLATNELTYAFNFVGTKEGSEFWYNVDLGFEGQEKTLSKEEVNKLIVEELVNFSAELIQKNEDYNNSLHKKNIFGQDPIEGIKARMSDKLNRIISKGFDDKTEDSLKDLFGYYIHYKIMTK